jgi:RHS repeat-associated protein
MREWEGRARRGWPWLLRAIFSAGLTSALSAGGEPSRVTTTVYVGKHFEVRDHDQPVKYVFEGSTRVARVTGSLSAGPRVQRLRLWSGWNLVSLAVTAEDLVGQLNKGTTGRDLGLIRIYRCGLASGDYPRVESGETVVAGTVLWIRAEADLAVGVVGEYQQAVGRVVPAGGGHVAGPGLQAWPRPDLPAGAIGWRYDADRQRWQAQLRGDLKSAAELPPVLAPGEALYVAADAMVELTPDVGASGVAFYHQDHLESSSVVTDASGEVIEETAYHPYGVPRQQARRQPIETHYGFTQKERDTESRLHYVEARYFQGVPGRFLSVDPRLSQHRFKSGEAAAEFFANPQRLNHYAYAVNNPLRFIDPLGEDIAKPRKMTPPPPAKGSTIELRGVEGASFRQTDLPIESFHIEAAYAVGGGAGSSSRGDQPATSSVIFTMRQGRHAPELLRMAAEGRYIKEATFVIREADPAQVGKEREYLRVKLSDVFISAYQSGAAVEGQGFDSLTLGAARIEIERVPPPGGPVPIPYPLKLFIDPVKPKP